MGARDGRRWCSSLLRRSDVNIRLAVRTAAQLWRDAVRQRNMISTRVACSRLMSSASNANLFVTIAWLQLRNAAPAKNTAAFALTHPFRCLFRCSGGGVSVQCRVSSARCVFKSLPVTVAGGAESHRLLSHKPALVIQS